MTHLIFPGLSQPKTPLFFDIQAMIAENGGRFRLAEKLTAELAKTYSDRTQSHNLSTLYWNKLEIAFIKDNYAKMSCHKISTNLCRNHASVRYKIFRLQKQGLLPHKVKVNSKYTTM